jgi:hypothetical protein
LGLKSIFQRIDRSRQAPCRRLIPAFRDGKPLTQLFLAPTGSKEFICSKPRKLHHLGGAATRDGSGNGQIPTCRGAVVD